MSDIGMDIDVDIGTLPISEWLFSVRHICLRYRNYRCWCRISPTLRSMSMHTYANTHIIVKLQGWWNPSWDCRRWSGVHVNHTLDLSVAYWPIRTKPVLCHKWTAVQLSLWGGGDIRRKIRWQISWNKGTIAETGGSQYCKGKTTKL